MANPKIPHEALESLMDEAGVGAHTKRKLRKANEPTKSTRGHGATVQKTSVSLPL